jgi:hypothetical protein
MAYNSAKTLLSAVMELSGGLLGAVEPSLRAAMVNLDMDRERYIYYFYYDGPIDEHKEELVSGAASEASTYWFYEAHFIQLDYPAVIPINGALVYLRKELGITPPAPQLLPRNPITISRAYLTYALGQGLLGRIIPSLRYALVGINEEEKKMRFYFYYDEKITKEILTLCQEAITVAKTAFPNDYIIDEVIEFVPFPKPYPATSSYFDNQAVYQRNEHLFD